MDPPNSSVYREQLITFEDPDPEKLPQMEEPPTWEVLVAIPGSEMHRLYLISLLLAIFTTFVVVILKKNSILKKITEFFPDSCGIMFLGMLVNLSMMLIHYFVEFDRSALLDLKNPAVLEHITITPIILHASFGLYHPHFFGQFWTIVIYAIVATVLNAILIALMLYFFNSATGIPMSIFICLTYASLISAVDPVAVLSVFEAVNANKQLYFLVFGESVLNDGVTYVMFDAFRAFASIESERINMIPFESYLCIAGSFVTKPLGGIFFGYLCGLWLALVTKYTADMSSSRIPLLNILFASLAYLMSISLKGSGILSLIAFGLTQERYTFRNISEEAKLKTKNLIHGLAFLMETFLFFLLGFEFIHNIQISRVWTEVICILVAIYFARVVVTIFLTGVINRLKIHRERIGWRWQILIIVGGLRGAVAFAMVLHYSGPYQHLFYDLTVITIFFTSIVNGLAAKPLVAILNLKQDEESSELDYKKVYGDKLGPFSRLYQKLERKYLFKAVLREHPGSDE